VGGVTIGLGATITSTRGAALLPRLAAETDFLWLDVRRLQAASFGFPPSVFLTGEPLDEYLRQGLLPVDPRVTTDAILAEYLAPLAAAQEANPACRIGIRVAGPVSEELLGMAHGMGGRVVAVDTAEVRSAQLALGKAALAERLGAANAEEVA
jgi:pyruvate,orthophosphate dikinase